MDNVYFKVFDRNFDAMRIAHYKLMVYTYGDTKSRNTYRQELRRLARALWAGAITQAEFEQALFASVDKNLRQAWNSGFELYGIAPDEQTADEMTDEERALQESLRELDELRRERSERERIFNLILAQAIYIAPLAVFILARKRASDEDREAQNLPPRQTPTTEINARIELWLGAYDGTHEEAKVLASGDQKLKWTLGVAEHCTSCIRLHGKVKRAWWWAESGILPAQNGAEYLECKGYQCKCKLVPTNDPETRGRMPVLP
jgi:hypothetical protein